jgi:hypothetical protein
MSNLLLDAFMLVLLFMAILFCWRLNKRLQGMRQMGAQMAPFMKNFSGYVNQISKDIETLKETAEISHKDLSEKIPQALSLKDDFDILLEHSEKIAARLDQIIEKAQIAEQHLQQTVQTVTKGYTAAQATQSPQRQKIEPELIKAQASSPPQRKGIERPSFEDHLPRINRPVFSEEKTEEPQEETRFGSLMSALRGMR